MKSLEVVRITLLFNNILTFVEFEITNSITKYGIIWSILGQ